MSRPNGLATEYLAELDHMLQGSEESLPAIGVNLSTLSRVIDLPLVSIDYGQTEIGKGLEPATKSRSPDDRGPRFSYVVSGLALPMDKHTQGEVVFYPLDYIKTKKGAIKPYPSQTNGWWKQRSQDGVITTHMPNEEPKIQENSHTHFDNNAFATWESPLAPPQPLILCDPEVAAAEARRAMAVVREKPADWKEMYEKDGRLQQHFVAVGEKAVTAAFEAMQDGSIGTTELPKPFKDMVDAVQVALDITR